MTTPNPYPYQNAYPYYSLNSAGQSEVNNPYPMDTSYSGFYFAFYASGGFTMEKGFPNIKLTTERPVIQYDVTQALQVTFDVRTFNHKLGLIKDASNINVLDTSFNLVADRFTNDSITISAAEFVTGMASSQVISVGTYATLYSDFVSYVGTYFGYTGGFETLFSNGYDFQFTNPVFDANSFISIINESITDASGAYVKLLDGSITVNDINAIIAYAVDSNIFGNRTPLTGITASDPSNNSNYGINDGFVAGDLIFIPTGSTITLTLAVDNENINSINNIGPTNVISATASSNNTSANGYFSETTTAAVNNIRRTLTAPILIKLANLS